MNGKMKGIPIPLRYTINTLLFVVFLLTINILISSRVIGLFQNKILMLIGVNIILAVSLNLATGYLGQLPLGHAGFMSVGAYASAIMMKSLELPAIVEIPLCIIFGGMTAAIFGIIIGIPALRLRGDYLAIITLGFGEIIRVILLNIDEILGFKLTHGAAGLKNIPKFTTFTIAFLCVGITCFIIHTMMKSRHGRAVLSIRENEIAAESCGVNTTYYKTMAFVMSAFFAGIAGSLFAGYLGVLTPGNFGFMKSIEILVMVVLGGMGSMIGSVISASVLTALPMLLISFAEYRMIVYSLLLIIVMIFKPSGLMGSYDFSLTRVLGKVMTKFRAKG